jgi:hypothetical protein
VATEGAAFLHGPTIHALITIARIDVAIGDTLAMLRKVFPTPTRVAGAVLRPIDEVPVVDVDRDVV